MNKCMQWIFDRGRRGRRRGRPARAPRASRSRAWGSDAGERSAKLTEEHAHRGCPLDCHRFPQNSLGKLVFSTTALRIAFRPRRSSGFSVRFPYSCTLNELRSVQRYLSQAGSEFTPQPSQNNAKSRSNPRENAATRGDPRGPMVLISEFYVLKRSQPSL